MTPPKLSVIIPTYNRASHLPTCVGSVLGGPAGGVEVVVVDDGSTDDTAGVARSLGPRVRYLRQANAGPGPARNAGFAASTGRYVTFLDSDDHWLPGGAGRLVAVLDAHADVPLVFGDARMGAAPEGAVSFVARFGGEAFARLPRVEVEPGAYRLDPRAFFRALARRNPVFPGSLVLRREAVEAAGGFDPELFEAEDYELLLRLAARYPFVYVADTPVSFYRQHEGGLTRDGDKMDRGFLKALRLALKNPALGPADRRWLRRQLIQKQFGYAYQAYDRGDLKAARERFAACLTSRPGPRSLGFWLASHLSPDVLHATRGLKRRLLG